MLQPQIFPKQTHMYNKTSKYDVNEQLGHNWKLSNYAVIRGFGHGV